MIGNRPMLTFARRTTFFPLVYWMVTRIGALYVVSRKRHSCGVTVLSIASASVRSGKPTWISVYFSQKRGSTSEVTLLFAFRMFLMSTSTK